MAPDEEAGRSEHRGFHGGSHPPPSAPDHEQEDVRAAAQGDPVAHPGHEAHDRHLRGAAHGHDKHEGHTPEMFRTRFWVAFILTLPVVFWAEHIQELLGYQAPVFAGSAWIPPLLGTAGLIPRNHHHPTGTDNPPHQHDSR